MEQPPALGTLHPEVRGKLISLILLNPYHLAILELGDLHIARARNQRLEARTEDIRFFPHDAIRVDPREIRIQKFVERRAVAFLESRDHRAVGLNHRIIVRRRLARLRRHQTRRRHPRQYQCHG